MKISKAQVFRYRLPLLEAFPRHDANDLWAQGFIYVVFSEDGLCGFGELPDAALTGDETITQAEHQLRHCFELSSAPTEPLLAPVEWAVSSALLNLEFVQQHKSFPQWMKLTQSPSVVLNALLDASRADFVDKGLRQATEGYRTFKIKVGDAPLSLEIARIRELLAVLGKDIVLRIDANQNLSLPHAVEIAHALKKAKVEYFEEPFKNFDDVEEFYHLTGVKIALDETVLTDAFAKWHLHEAVSTFVLKPSRIGSVERLADLIKTALASKREFVVSSTYETGIGLSWLAQIASVGQSRNVAMGLATGGYFASDLLSPPLRSFRGQIAVAPLANLAQQVNLADSSACNLLFERHY